MVPPGSWLRGRRVGYDVEFVDLVRDYLEQLEGLTDGDRAAVVDGVIEELSRDADRFLALRPLAHESLCFRYDYPHATEQTIYDFDFVVDASHLEMGVVRVAYVECTLRPVH
jgi:hypothetical protein